MATDAYRRMARLYDRVVEPAASALRREGLEVVPPREGISILDVGCGTGTQLELYRRPGCRLAGIDLSPAMVAEAQRKLGDAADIRCEDATRTAHETAAFDLVMLVTVLHELTPELRRPVLDECRRVMKSDGQLLVMDYHPGPYPFPRGWAFKGIITFMELLGGRSHFRHYRDYLRAGALDGLLGGSGLRVVSRHVTPSGTAAVHVLEHEPVVATAAAPVEEQEPLGARA